MAHPLSPEERRQRARIAALARWSREDPAHQARRMRDGFERRFIDQVDPDRVLPEAERKRRAEAARRLYYARLSYAGLKARRARAAERRREAS